jgi:hypothetical protein
MGFRPRYPGAAHRDEVGALGLNVDEVASYVSPIDLAAVEDGSRLTCVDRQEGNFITLAARRNGERWISGSFPPPSREQSVRLRAKSWAPNCPARVLRRYPGGRRLRSCATRQNRSATYAHPGPRSCSPWRAWKRDGRGEVSH